MQIKIQSFLDEIWVLFALIVCVCCRCGSSLLLLYQAFDLLQKGAQQRGVEIMLLLDGVSTYYYHGR